MISSNRICVVPISDLAPLVKRWLGRGGHWRESHKGVWERGGGKRVLAELSGLNIRVVSGIADQTLDRPYVRFDVADRLLCAMDMPDAWQTPPLCEHYGPLEVKKSEKGREGYEEAVKARRAELAAKDRERRQRRQRKREAV